MAKVIQIRDVPEDVRDALAAAAQAQGLSLTRYLQRELERLARRPLIARHNITTIRRTQHTVGERIDRTTIRAALEQGRRG